MKILVMATLLLSSSLTSASIIPKSELVGSFSVNEISLDEFNFHNPKTSRNQSYKSINGGINNIGQVILMARGLVALGEAVYQLVQLGKPKNVTEYAPISVVPRDPDTKEIVDIFDLEGFSAPQERSYIAKVKNGFGKEVVSFTYKVMFAYGGSFNGAGKYLTNVIIIPGSIKTSYGWDFTASMKLSGIMNHGTKTNPVAGIMVTIKYTMNSWSTAYERNDTIHITGRGEIKNTSAE